MSSKNFHKQDMASIEWLATHFYAKSNERIKEISRLPIFKGDQVLDLCCGPGFFLNYFCDLVGPSGKVIGVDHDPISLDFAQRYLLGFPFRNWDLVHSDLVDYIDKIYEFDVILIFNAIGYFEDPIKLISKIISNMKKGSRIIIKDFDLEGAFISPLDELHWANLIIHAKKNDALENPLKFTNFFGRKIHSLGNSVGQPKFVNEVWSQAMAFPFNQYEKTYIRENIEALILQAKSTCPKKTIEYFEDSFCKDDKSFFENSSSLFVENEHITTILV